MDLSVGVSGVERRSLNLIAVFFIVFTSYFIAYRIRNKRFEKKELERMRALKASGAIPDEKEKGPAGNRR